MSVMDNIKNMFGDTPSNENIETPETIKESIIGEYKPKRSFISFISGLRGRVRLVSDIAYIKASSLSGTFTDEVFKITICDEGTYNVDQVNPNNLEEIIDDIDKNIVKRIFSEIDDLDVTGYTEKYVVATLEFFNKDNQKFYLEVEEQKPIDKLANLLSGLEDEEDNLEVELSSEKIIEDKKLSNKGMSFLDELLNNEEDIQEDDEKDVLLKTEKDVEIFVDAIENPHKPNENLKEAKNSYQSMMEESFKKMNQEKIDELKGRIELVNREISKCDVEISNNERKKEKQQKDLEVLEGRLEELGGDKEEPNGYVFFVGEAKKNSDIDLKDSDMELVDKISKVIGAKTDALVNALTGETYEIRIADKEDIEVEPTDIPSDMLVHIKRLGKVKMVGNGKFEYSGDLNWHQLVSKMIKAGFEQDEDFDKYCGSNSYESHEGEKEDYNLDETKEIDGDTSTSEIEEYEKLSKRSGVPLLSTNEPKDFVLVPDYSGDISFMDDYFSPVLNPNPLNSDYKTFETDGGMSIIPVEEYPEYYEKNIKPDIIAAGFDPDDSRFEGFDMGVECVYVGNVKGDVNVNVKVEGFKTIVGYSGRDDIYYDFQELEVEDIIIDFPEGSEVRIMKDFKLPINVIRDKKISKVLKDDKE